VASQNRANLNEGYNNLSRTDGTTLNSKFYRSDLGGLTAGSGNEERE